MKRFLNAKTILVKFCVGVAILFAGGVFVGCEKNEVVSEENITENIVKDIEVKDGILCFKNDSVFNATLQQVNNMNEQDFETWEKAIGFTSYKTIKKKAIEEFTIATTEKEVIELVNKYSNIFERVKNINGEDELQSNIENNEKYISNENCIYTINNLSYKILKDYIITTDISNTKQLIEINSKNIKNLDENYKIETKNSLNSLKGTLSKENTSELNGKKIVLKVNVTIVGQYAWTTYISTLKVDAYKKILLWIPYNAASLTMYTGNYWVNEPIAYNNSSYTYYEGWFGVGEYTAYKVQELYSDYTWSTFSSSIPIANFCLTRINCSAIGSDVDKKAEIIY